MDYDIVIATANRPDILRVSLPTMMNQSRPAKRLIIADASDDPGPVEQAVRETTASAPFDVVVMRAPRGAAPQRNAALPTCTSPVIFFPDDDSLWFPDTAELTMRIYERDAQQQIGGVGQVEATEPPFALSTEQRAARRATWLDRVRYRLALLRFAVLRRLVDNPLETCGRELMRRHRPPAWLAEAGGRPVGHQIGFRMSFRAAVVRRYLFNEDLWKPRSGLEDFDLSFSTLKDLQLAEAAGAKVYHHRVGGKRGDGLMIGLTQVLNLCYVVCRHTEPGARSRRAVPRYVRYFIWEHRLRGVGGEYDRQKLRGIRLGYAALDYLMICRDPADLTRRYHEAFRLGLEGRTVQGDGDRHG